jgi:hypothetical protein
VNTAISCALAVAFAPAPAHADGFFHHLADELGHRLAALDAARGPTLVPPVPLAVAWRPQKLAPSLDLDAPLLALAIGDLDGDGRAELYAVTEREVIALAIAGNRVRELGRVTLAGELAPRRPRDPVGAAVIDGKHLIASSSQFAHAFDVSWRGKTLVADPRAKPGIELCAGELAQLERGRDYFGDASYGTRCRDDLVSADGHPLHVRGKLSTAGKLDVTVQRCEAGATSCAHVADFAYTHVGIGFAIVDLDRDGTPEVVFAGAGAPGEPDELRVVSLGADEHKTKLRKSFDAGGVAAIAAGDLQQKGPVIVAAVRLEGSTRVDLWRMN